MEAKILGIDVAKSTGYYFSEEEKGLIQFQSLVQYEKDIKQILDLYKPDLVVTGRPNRFYKTIETHFSYLAIIQLCCEKRNITYHAVMDVSARKAILGNGRASKEDIMAYFGEDQQDIADSAMFQAYGRILLGPGNDK